MKNNSLVSHEFGSCGLNRSRIISVLQADMDGTILDHNRGAMEMLLYSTEELTGCNLDERILLETDDSDQLTETVLHRPGPIALCSNLFVPEAPVQTVDRIIMRKDGVRFHARLTREFFSSPAPFQLLTVQDITEFKESDSAMRRRHDELKCWVEQRTAELSQVKDDLVRLIDTANTPIFGVDTSFRINEWNQCVSRLTGYSKDDIIGQNLLDLLFSGAHREGFFGFLDAALHDMPAQCFETRLITRSGTGKDLLLNATARKDDYDHVIGIVVIGQDISTLLQSQRMLRTVLQTVPVRVFYKDSHSRYLGCNKLFAMDAGIEIPDEIVGLRDDDLAWSDCSEKMRSEDVVVIDSGLPQIDIEDQMTMADGRQLWVIKSIVPLKDEDGKIQGILGAYQDITRQKLSEKTLETERLNLEKIVEQRTRELRDSLTTLTTANLRLEEASRHKSNFLSTMSHELRTPLNAVLGYGDLLGKQFFGPLNEKQVSYVDQINSSGKHLLELINDILDVAKIDAGAMNLELDEFPLRDLIESTQSMLKAQFKKKQLQTEIFISPELHLVVADQRKLKQILLNLVTNAVKYTPEGGYIKIHAFRENDGTLKIIVVDTGIGIEDHEIGRIFDEFYQADKIRDAQLGGTGIGLALTRRLVELHGGRIGVESRVGEGSAFWFSIPQRADSRKPMIAPVPPHSDEISNSRAGGLRILVAEDNDVNLALLTDILKIQKHEVIAARNGRQAVDLARAVKPDIILMDIRMPILDGMAATRELRTYPETRSIPIIALTASTGPEAKRQQLEAGCSDHLAKPIQMDQLFQILKQYCPEGRVS